MEQEDLTMTPGIETKRPLLRHVTDDGTTYLFTVGPGSAWSIERNEQVIDSGMANGCGLAEAVKRFRRECKRSSKITGSICMFALVSCV